MEIKQYTILCVDDEPGILAALKRALSDDFIVETALTAEEGAGVLTRNLQVDLILSDSHMPGICGFDFLTWCYENYPDIPRYALTGYADEAMMRGALSSQVVLKVIAKPWDNDQIVSILKKAIEDQGGRV